jgi:hypothetical protein
LERDGSRLWGFALALGHFRASSFELLKHALSLTAVLGSFSHRIPSVRFTFYLQPLKVNKKGRSPNYVLHPIILDILQGETGFFRSTASPS